MKLKFLFFTVLLILCCLLTISCDKKDQNNPLESVSNGSFDSTADSEQSTSTPSDKETGGISFKTLQVNESNVYGKVSSDTTTFSFINEILIDGDATYTVYFDITGTQPIPTKTVSLESGDNTFYVLEQFGNNIKLYTVTIRRCPIYTVTFCPYGALNFTSQTEKNVKEGELLSEIPEPTRDGYTFIGWDYDFSAPIMKNTWITANWTPNTYNITYDVNGGDVLENSTQIVTYNTEYTLAAPTRAGYTFSGWYHGETRYQNGTWRKTENVTLTATWAIDQYQVTVNKNIKDGGAIEGGGLYDHNTIVTLKAAPNRGHFFNGWYLGEKLISTNPTYTFTVTEPLTLTARFRLDEKLEDFDYLITETGLTIYRVKDKTKTSYELPNDVTSIGGRAFYDCKSLKNIIIPSGVKSIGDEAFSGCSDLESVTIPNSVTSIGFDAFRGCTKLIQVENGVSYVDKWVVDCDDAITHVAFRTNTIGIGDNAFDYCQNLTNIEIPKSVMSIGNYAFQYCSGLKNVIIPQSVTSINQGTFYDCYALKNITIPNSVTNIGSGAFISCDHLTLVYYGSTASDWQNISIEVNNFDLTSAARYYYSETQPIDTTYIYWRYVNSVPTVW